MTQLTAFLLYLIPAFFYYRKIRNIPLHPDSGEFLYPGMIRAMGKTYEPYRINEPVRIAIGGHHRTVLPMPPDIYCDLDAARPYVSGGDPVIRQKQAVYGFYAWLGGYGFSMKGLFRVIQASIILVLALMMFLALEGPCGIRAAFAGGALVWALCALPFFDAHQIHAELYGTLMLSVLFTLLATGVFEIVGPLWAGLFCGLILCVVMTGIKMTFIPPCLLFCLFPFFTEKGGLSFHIAVGTAFCLAASAVLAFFTNHWERFVSAHSPRLLWRYRMAIPTLKKNRNEESGQDGRGSVVPPFSLEYLYHHFELLYPFLLLSVVGLSAVAMVFFPGCRTPFFVFSSIWLAVEWIVLRIQNKYYPSHFLPMIFPSVIVFTVTAHGALSAVTGTGGGPERAAGFIFLSGAVMCALVVGWAVFSYTFGKAPLNFFMAPLILRKNPHLLQLIAAPVVGDCVRKQTKPEDRVFVFGYASTVYHYAKRRASLEFLEGFVGVDPEIAESVWQDRWPWWVCRDIHRYAPVCLVDMDGRLDVRAIFEATGYCYEKETVLYNCFTVYRMKQSDSRVHRFGPVIPRNLTGDVSREYVRQREYNRMLFVSQGNRKNIQDDTLKSLLDDVRRAIKKCGEERDHAD